jgi:hypothetical protein
VTIEVLNGVQHSAERVGGVPQLALTKRLGGLGVPGANEGGGTIELAIVDVLLVVTPSSSAVHPFVLIGDVLHHPEAQELGAVARSKASLGDRLMRAGIQRARRRWPNGVGGDE